jgi:peroxiredoxin
MSAPAHVFPSIRAIAVAACALVALGSGEVSAASPVVRPAPDFSFAGVGARKGLRSFRGQPVVLVIARSPDTRDFRKQAKRLASIYQEFASRGTVFVAAFSEKEGQIQSNIPFVLVGNGPSVAAAYGLDDDFRIAIIGADGNLDLSTDKVLSPFRIREVIQNSYTVQQAARKETPKGPPQ